MRVADPAILRYVAVGESISQHEVALPVIVNAVSAQEAAAAAADPEDREEVLVLRAASARDEAVRLADRGEYDPARKLISSTVDELRQAGLADEAAELDLAAPAMIGPTPPCCGSRCVTRRTRAGRAVGLRLPPAAGTWPLEIATGAPCSGSPPATPSARRSSSGARDVQPITDMVGGGPFRLQPGQWTDDTSMALCLAESLVEPAVRPASTSSPLPALVA